MRVSLDIERLRHVRNHVTSGNPTISWDDFKGGIDSIGGLLMTSGLVHALLVGLRGEAGSERESMKRAVEALASWLQDDKSPVKKQVQSGAGSPENLAIALIKLDNVHDAMVIQAEAMRYLSQAKLLANAFRGEV